MGGTRFMVQWEEHPSHLATRLGQLLEHQTLVDVTLMCNTHTLRVHRAVLAACSPYFETILQRQLGMHPLIVLKDMQFSVLKSLIEFMYCGETSVTEDNLGALLQAAKFFQVKGLSAMTKEALGLVPNTKSTINGDAARKAFVGRPKRVGMQQTFVTSGLKTVQSSHASGSHSSSNELPTLPTKTTFQTISKPVAARPDTQQQTDTAQLLLSLSGSEFPKQTFHTVSKNVRFQHNVSGSSLSVESPRTSAVEANVKTKEVVGRIPVMTTNGGKTAIAGAAAATTTTNTVPQQGGHIAELASVSSGREDVAANPQSVYLTEGHRRRGRPVKRQMNMLFQERVMTDADAALHKEAEASRKALEMLRQEMSSEPIESSVAATSNITMPVTPAIVQSPLPTATSISNLAQISNATGEHVQKGLVKHGVQGGTKIQVQSLQAPVSSTPRTVSTQNASSTLPTKRMNANVYKTSTTTTTTTSANNNNNNNTVSNISAKKNIQTVSSMPSIENASNSAENAMIKPEEPEVAQQVYELSNEATQEPSKEENVEFQVSAENIESEPEGGRNTNIVYQVTDSNSASAGSVMSQYMEVLKEAGLPTDVPILLDSGDGSYVTVNEEVLMNIVNGGVLQCHVTEGNFVAGDGVEFIVQEITEDEMEAVQAQVQEQTADGTSLPKEIENSAEATTAENTVEVSEVKLPAEEETQLIPEQPEPCTQAPEEKQTDLPEETSLPDAQNMETDSEILQTDENMTNEESHELQSESVNVNSDANIGKETVLSETKTYNEPEVDNDLEIKNESDSQTVLDESVKVEGNIEGEICSVELPNNKNNLQSVKAENNDEMSVEQALQAMMGESSDTETEACVHNEVQSTEKDENIVTDLDTMTQSQKEEKSEDLHMVLRNEERPEDDLRLVLSNDTGDATDDNTDSFALESSGNPSSVAHDQENNSEELNAVELSEIPIDVKEEIKVEPVDQNTDYISVTEPNEYESVAEQSDGMEQIAVDGSLKMESVSEEEATSSLGVTTEVENSVLKEEEEEDIMGEGEEVSEYVESVPGSEVSGDSQEVSQLTSHTMSSADGACNSTEYYKPKGAIISPSKDIPFAVGLLPLKTALEKLQAMPEYHPRKTRSSSTGKESTPDMPAARVKRKTSSSDGAEKRLKLSIAEEGTLVEQADAEETFDGDATMEVMASTISEERKEESVLSMPELVTEPTEG